MIMPNELAIVTTPPTATAAAPPAAADSAAGSDFVTALAGVLSTEAAQVASPLVPPLLAMDDESSDLQELLEAGTAAIDPQALMVSLEQAQRIDAAAPALQAGARAISTQSDRGILAAMTAGAAALVEDQVSDKSKTLLDAVRGATDLRDAKAETRIGSENSTASLLATSAAAHERISGLSEKPIIRAHVGTASWTEQLAGKLTLMVGRGIQSASIQLSPENLGPLEIRISVQNEQASVWFGAAHADTRAALEQALPRLRELLAGQGLNLSDAGVFREAPRQSNKSYVPATNSSVEGEREFNVAIGIRGMVDAYA
jgi:flagellar hook-length control protein FliK